MDRKLVAFQRLLTIMDELREGCPWDRKQTLESLRNLTIEETYELADAILDQDLEGIKEEIGDKRGIANSHNNIADIYLLMGNYKEAMENYLASLKIKQEIGDKGGIANSYSNIGELFQIRS